MKFEIQSPRHRWANVQISDDDWAGADPALLAHQLRHMMLIRVFEETVLNLAADGLVHGPAHSAIGQEGGAVGCLLGLRQSDLITGSHRAHHQFLAKCLAALEPLGTFAGKALTAVPDDSINDLLQTTVAEIMGLKTGWCRGRGGSMHLLHDEFGVMGTNAIVGGGVPSAVGAAWARQCKQSGDVVVAHLGDGAINIGAVTEAMNLAALWDLPVVFFIENNRYAVSTTVAESTREVRLSSRGVAYGMPSYTVDGMDVLAVHLLTQSLLPDLRAGKGPVVIEADVYRYFHQNGGFPGSAFGYRSKDEESNWRARDPLTRVGQVLQQTGTVLADEIAKFERDIEVLMARLCEPLLEVHDNERAVSATLWPDTGFKDEGIRGDLSELEGLRFVECEDNENSLVDGKFVTAIAKVLHKRMATDERIVVLGEDIHKLRGGTDGATRGLVEDFPSRVLGTPISEEGFAGMALGMALEGHFRPIIEFMYADFCLVAGDQVFNQIAKARHMFGGSKPVPLVLRSKFAAGTGYGSQHSMDPAGLYSNWPGWRIVAPSTAYDYVGLMNSALACDDPVLVIEHVDLYQRKQSIPESDYDYAIPLGSAKVIRDGRQCTVLSYLRMLEICENVADDIGLDAEIIDLRSLDRAGIDWATIEKSIRKTGRVVIAEQGSLTASYGAMLGDEVQRRYFDLLDGPVLRIHGGEASPSVSKVLEQATLAGADEVRAVFARVCNDTDQQFSNEQASL